MTSCSWMNRRSRRAITLYLNVEKTVAEGAGAAGLAAVLSDPAAVIAAVASGWYCPAATSTPICWPGHRARSGAPEADRQHAHDHAGPARVSLRGSARRSAISAPMCSEWTIGACRSHCRRARRRSNSRSRRAMPVMARKWSRRSARQVRTGDPAAMNYWQDRALRLAAASLRSACVQLLEPFSAPPSRTPAPARTSFPRPGPC